MQCNSESKYNLHKTRKLIQNDLSKQKKINHEQKPIIMLHLQTFEKS